MISPSVLFATEKKFGKGDSSKENTNHSPANADPQTEFFSCFQPALRHPTLGYHMNIRISYQQWTMFTLPNFAKPLLTMQLVHYGAPSYAEKRLWSKRAGTNEIYI